MLLSFEIDSVASSPKIKIPQMTKNKSHGAEYILLGSKTAKVTPCFPEKNPIGRKDGRGRSKSGLLATLPESNEYKLYRQPRPLYQTP